MFTQTRRLPKFENDLKKLLKKYRSLDEDIKNFEDTALKMYHNLNNKHDGIVRISNLGIVTPEIYKAKSFACKALKGRGKQSGIRIIYAYCESSSSIDYIEIYHKNEKENEDRDRILQQYNKLE